MGVITNGNVIENAGHQIEQSVTRRYPHEGAPTDGVTYAGIIQPGEFVEDVLTGNLYEWNGTLFSRIDTV